MTTTRTVRFTAPPPRDVARRCEISADVVVRTISALHRDDAPALAERLALAEELRGVLVDLALAAGWLNDADPAEGEATLTVSAEPDEMNRTDDDGLLGYGPPPA